MMHHSKKAALELSVSTIVVIVLGVTMLIIGMVLVRNIMCGALGLTEDINGKVRGEITRLFGSSDGEVVCLGAGSEPVQMIPDKLNVVYCGINAERQNSYTITLKEMTMQGIPQSEINSWKQGSDVWTGTVAPGDREPKKVVRLDIPKDAPEGLLTMKFEVKRGATIISTKDLDFEIKRIGLVKTTVC